MKKIFAAALAAGALAAGGAAQAQDVGDVILNLLGMGQPTYQQGHVVQGQVLRDTYGRTFYYDQYGRQVYVQQNAPQIVGYDQWGRPIYNSGQAIYGQQPIYGNQGTYAYSGRSWDVDGDGIANHRDRYPNDPRFR